MSVTIKQLIEDAVTKAFVTINNIFQPKITELQYRNSTGGFYMLGDGSAYTVSDPTNPEQKRLRRQAAFLYAFNRGEYIGGRQYAMRNNTVDGKSMVTLNATIVMNDSQLSGESYDLFIIDRSSYDDSTDTLTTRATFIANQSNGARTYRGVYNGTKVGSAAATGTCTLDELAPTTFNNITNSIKYKGTGATGITYNMIRFIDNTTDDYGYSIAIGGGGTTIIGGGESAATILSDNMFNTAAGGENMVVANDNGITFLSNVQNGTASAHKMIMDSSGNLLINTGGSLYVGSNKGAAYTQQGTFIGSNGNIALTGSGSSAGSGGHILWAWNGASSSTAYLREYMQGYLQVANNLMVQNAVLVGNGPKTDYYTQSGVGLAPNGNITLTGTTTTGVGAGLYFAYNGSSSYSQWMRAAYNSTYGGYIEVSPSLIANYHIRAIGAGEHYCEAQNTTTGVRILLNAANTGGSVNGLSGIWTNGYYTGSAFSSSSYYMIYRSTDGRTYLHAYSQDVGTPVVSGSTANKHVSLLHCNTATQLGIWAEWASTTNKYMYVTVGSSDPRLKYNINDCNIDALSVINKIQLHSFNWKDNDKHWDVGFVAPELYEIDPCLTIKPKDDEKEYWCIDDFYLTGLQTKAIQELSAENKQLKAEITELKNTLNSINERLKKLEV